MDGVQKPDSSSAIQHHKNPLEMIYLWVYTACCPKERHP